MMVVSIDQADVFARATPSLLAMPQVELMTVTPIFLCRWRGRREPPPAPTADRPAWSRIKLYTAGEALLDWRPDHDELSPTTAQAGRARRHGAARHNRLRNRRPASSHPGWFKCRTAPT